MDWLALISTIINRVPIERVLFPPRDNIKATGEFLTELKASETERPSTPKNPTPTIKEPETAPKQAVATACVPCALGHFSTSAGLLNEAVRFKKEGITSNEILDRIAKVLEEQNALERVDLTEEKIRKTPAWERDLAEEALQQSRSLRHRLETLTTIEELGQAAADSEEYYRNLNRKWWKRRFAVAETKMTLKEAKELAAEEAAKQVEERWPQEETDLQTEKELEDLRAMREASRIKG